MDNRLEIAKNRLKGSAEESCDGPEEATVDFSRVLLEKALSDLPAMPGVITKVLEETEKEDPSAAALEKLISSDQGLVSKVLRVVNSAYYGLPGQITSVGQAVVILGLQQVRNLVLSVGAISTMPIRTPRQQSTLQQFWVHSFGTAAATQLISRKKGVTTLEAESMFVGGLLHDIGRLFLFSHFPDVYESVITASHESGSGLDRTEKDVLQMTHGEIGSFMASKWQLPPILVETIRDHEGPFTPNSSVVVMAVHIGDSITKHLYVEATSEEDEAIDQRAWDWLDFDAEEFEWLKSETAIKVEQASNLFGMLAA